MALVSQADFTRKFPPRLGTLTQYLLALPQIGIGQQISLVGVRGSSGTNPWGRVTTRGT